MAHCPYEALADLEDVLSAVRTWELVQERSPGVFYVKRLPFLHFHVDRSGARWADARRGKDWGPRLAVQTPSTPKSRKAFQDALIEYHAATVAAVQPKRKP